MVSLYVEIPYHFDIVRLQNTLWLVPVLVPFVCSVQPIHTTQFPMNHSGDMIVSLLILFLLKFSALVNDMGNNFTSLLTHYTQWRLHTLVHMKLHIIRSQSLFLCRTDENFSAGHLFLSNSTVLLRQ